MGGSSVSVDRLLDDCINGVDVLRSLGITVERYGGSLVTSAHVNHTRQQQCRLYHLVHVVQVSAIQSAAAEAVDCRKSVSGTIYT